MDEVISKKIETFFTRFKHQTYTKGEILVRADDDPLGVFYLKEGFVKQYAISHSGDELVINVFKPIAFFPMNWAINQTPNKYFYEAMSDVELWRAPREEVITFIKNNPDVLYDLISRVFSGVDGLLTRMTYLMSGSAYARLITELLIYVNRFAKGNSPATLTISEKDIAAQSGLTRETVSREVKILKEKKLVTSVKHQLIIQDVAKLKIELERET